MIAELAKELPKTWQNAAAAYAGDERFGQEGRTGGGIVMRHFADSNQERYNYKPLSPAYAARKRVRLPGKPILVATGELKSSVERGGRVVSATDKGAKVRFVNLVEYAIYHQTGTAKMPRRSPVDPNAEDKAEVKKIASTNARDLIRRLKLKYRLQ